MEAQNTMDLQKWALEKYGPLLTTEDVAEILKRSANAVRKSSCDKKSDLNKAKVNVGRRCYFRVDAIADLMAGRPVTKSN